MYGYRREPLKKQGKAIDEGYLANDMHALSRSGIMLRLGVRPRMSHAFVEANSKLASNTTLPLNMILCFDKRPNELHRTRGK